MSVESISNTLATTSIADPPHLLFKPSGGKAWLHGTFDNIPRYLFRVATPESSGSSDEFWVKSKNACADQCQTRDVFDQDDKHDLLHAVEASEVERLLTQCMVKVAAHEVDVRFTN